jgi:hypothetical protein
MTRRHYFQAETCPPYLELNSHQVAKRHTESQVLPLDTLRDLLGDSSPESSGTNDVTLVSAFDAHVLQALQVANADRAKQQS